MHDLRRSWPECVCRPLLRFLHETAESVPEINGVLAAAPDDPVSTECYGRISRPRLRAPPAGGTRGAPRAHPRGPITRLTCPHRSTGRLRRRCRCPAREPPRRRPPFTCRIPHVSYEVMAGTEEWAPNRPGCRPFARLSRLPSAVRDHPPEVTGSRRQQHGPDFARPTGRFRRTGPLPPSGPLETRNPGAAQCRWRGNWGRSSRGCADLVAGGGGRSQENREFLSLSASRPPRPARRTSSASAAVCAS